MLVRNLGAVAGLALVAEAFIIPSTISAPEFSDEASAVFFGGEADEGDYSIVPIPNDLGEALKAIQIGVSAIDGIRTSGHVDLACPECKPVPSADADVQCSSTSIYLDFKTSEDLKALELNGQHLYPLDAWKPYFKIKKMSVYGPVAVFADVSDIRSLLEERSIEAADDTDALIIDLVFQIWALDGTSVSVDSVHLRLLQDPSGNLQLVDVVKAAPIPTITPTMEFIEFIDADTEDLIEGVVVDIPMEETCGEGMSLSAIFCRVQSYVKQKVEDWHLKQPSDSFAPCSNETRAYDEFVPLTRPIIHGGIPKYAEQPDFDHDEIPHAGNHWHTHGHGYENEYSFLHKFASFIRNFVVGFLAPVFIGIVAGLTASILGMLVGTCIAWLWIKLVRGGRRGNLSANQEARAREVANDDDIVDEKEVLLDHAPTMDDVEAPPVYIEKE